MTFTGEARAYIALAVAAHADGWSARLSGRRAPAANALAKAIACIAVLSLYGWFAVNYGPERMSILAAGSV